MNEGAKTNGKCVVLATTEEGELHANGRTTLIVHYGKWSRGVQIVVESEDVQIHEELAQRKTSVSYALILLLLLPSQTHENRIFSFNTVRLKCPMYRYQ
jgi:hypothetical protein